VIRPSRALVILGLMACGPAYVDPTASTALFRFDVSDMVRNSPNLTRPPVGTVYGNIFLSEDVSVSGPRNGSDEFGYVEIQVDLTNGISAAENGFTTQKLAPNSYTFLGFLDTNGNALPAKDPDPGDLATLPYTNKFEITDGGQSKKTIVFDLIYN
jgi:hypothetical protein